MIIWGYVTYTTCHCLTLSCERLFSSSFVGIWDLLAQIRISRNLIRNLRARRARRNFIKIYGPRRDARGARGDFIKICGPRRDLRSYLPSRCHSRTSYPPLHVHARDAGILVPAHDAAFYIYLLPHRAQVLNSNLDNPDLRCGSAEVGGILRSNCRWPFRCCTTWRPAHTLTEFGSPLSRLTPFACHTTEHP